MLFVTLFRRLFVTLFRRLFVTLFRRLFVSSRLMVKCDQHLPCVHYSKHQFHTIYRRMLKYWPQEEFYVFVPEQISYFCRTVPSYEIFYGSVANPEVGHTYSRVYMGPNDSNCCLILINYYTVILLSK